MSAPSAVQTPSRPKMDTKTMVSIAMLTGIAYIVMLLSKLMPSVMFLDFDFKDVVVCIGALVATLGCILPSCFIVMALAYLYYRYKGLSMVQGILSGLRPAVVAMITSAGISLLILSLYGAQELPADLSGVDWISMGIFTVAILILRRWKVNPIWIMAGAGAAGVLLYSIL